MPAGRPRKYQDPEEFAQRVTEYFEDVKDSGRPPTIVGLALFLGFTERHSLAQYGKREEFSSTVKRAKTLIEKDRTERLVLKDEYTPGLAMDLRVNHNWEDPQKMEHSGPGGKPIESQSTTKLDPSNLTREQIEAIASIKVDPD